MIAKRWLMCYILPNGPVVKLVYTRDLKSLAARRVGSIPTRTTNTNTAHLLRRICINWTRESNGQKRGAKFLRKQK